VIDLKFALKEFQYGFVFSKVKFPAMKSAWGTGKTLCGILRALTYSKLVPGNLGIIFRKEFTDLRDSTCKDFEKYTQLKIDSHREVKLSNGSQILFRHLEELNNIQNINLGWFMIEQAEELETDTEFFTLFGRLRRESKPFKQFKDMGLQPRSGWIIANAGADWIKRVWNGKDSNYHLTTAVTYDNASNLPADFLESLDDIRRKRPEIFNRFVLNHDEAGANDFILIKEKHLEALKGVIRHPPETKRLISCDPSSGGDECVIYVFENEKIIDSRYLHERDTMKIAGNIAIMAQEHAISDFIIDSIGIGKGITDRLGEINKKWRVIACNSAMPSLQTDRFLNIRAEMWWETFEKCQEKHVGYPEDEELRKQLTAVKYEVLNSKGRIRIEDKKKIRERLGYSPDRADAFVMGIWALKNCPEWKCKDAFSMDAEPAEEFDWRTA